MSEQIRVLLVDDHEVVRKGTRAYLENLSDFKIVGEASSGEEAVGLAAALKPDVVLMDLIMPEMDGVETTRRLKAIHPETQIVILTSYHDDSDIFPVIEAGALSYLLKDSRLEEVAEALRLAVKNEAVLDPNVASRVVKKLAGRHEETPNPFIELTEREMDVLMLIADGLSNSKIAEELVISEHTVKTYVSNILSKLNLTDRTQAAVYAWRKGIKRYR
jgi:NarL family two-component system response regulator LiaR